MQEHIYQHFDNEDHTGFSEDDSITFIIQY